MTIVAIYDGEVFRPTESVPLAPNTRVRLTIEVLSTQRASSPRPNGPTDLEDPSGQSIGLDAHFPRGS